MSKGKTGKKSYEQLEAELHVIKTTKVVEGIVAILLTSIRCGTVVLIAKYGYLSLSSLAGHQTMSNIVFNVFSNVGFSQGLSYVMCAGGVGYGITQRSLRKRTIKRASPRAKQLESIIDPSRSSSELTETGDTRPEDIS